MFEKARLERYIKNKLKAGSINPLRTCGGRTGKAMQNEKIDSLFAISGGVLL